ncbi:hypothetical protein [Allokutzneria sp. NRRL B-24872]|uniref:hypothetical protein n=1 Tax=Allokutzneria sp. NRRL B-24872 TaxID=1137961 RepID=UPI000A3CE55F|nr:hypothetical protein [Allokutzneria sp. NRRL B-24872]
MGVLVESVFGPGLVTRYYGGHELFQQSADESQDDPVYVVLDLSSGGLYVATAWDVRTLRGFPERLYPIPPMSRRAADELLDRIHPLADRVLRDTKLNPPETGPDALAADAEIRRITEALSEDDLAEADKVHLYQVEEVVRGDEAEAFGITADTTFARLLDIEQEILDRMPRREGVWVCPGLKDYLLDLERATPGG